MTEYLNEFNPNEEPDLELDFEMVMGVLTKGEREVVYNHINEIGNKIFEANNRFNFLKSKIKRYFEIKNSPFTLTSDEIVELNELETILK